MAASRRDLLVWQFELTWSLFEYHLDRLDPADVFWEPAGLCWTVRRTDAGWVADWQDVEPDPVPVPTIAWLTWHLGWWWSTALDHLRNGPIRERDAVEWPGGGDELAVWLRGMRSEWLAAVGRLDEAGLDAAASFPWPPEEGRTVGQMLAWVNAEMMKNVAEIGQMRLLRTARDREPDG